MTKIWTLPHKYLITNKIREITFKFNRRFHLDKCSLKRLILELENNDINTLCCFGVAFVILSNVM